MQMQQLKDIFFKTTQILPLELLASMEAIMQERSVAIQQFTAESMFLNGSSTDHLSTRWGILSSGVCS